MLKSAVTTAHITFPHPLIGMFALVTLLLAVGESAAATVLRFYTPALDWCGVVVLWDWLWCCVCGGGGEGRES